MCFFYFFLPQLKKKYCSCINQCTRLCKQGIDSASSTSHLSSRWGDSVKNQIAQLLSSNYCFIAKSQGTDGEDFGERMLLKQRPKVRVGFGWVRGHGKDLEAEITDCLKTGEKSGVVSGGMKKWGWGKKSVVYWWGSDHAQLSRLYIKAWEISFLQRKMGSHWWAEAIMWDNQFCL